MEDLTFGKRILNFLCGFESGAKNSFEVNAATEEATKRGPAKSPEEAAKEAAEFLDEPPFWKK